MRFLLALLLVAGSVTSFAQKLSPLEAINRSNPAIVDYKIIGACPRGGLLVQHWIPVAWTESAPAGQSSIAGVREAAENTSALRTSGLESSVSTRVLNFSNWLWKRSNIARSYGNRVCSISDADVPAGITPYDTSDCASFGAVLASIATVALVNEDIREVYTSRADPGWVSGCRDKSRVDEAVTAQVRCDTEHLGAALQPGGARAAAVAARDCVGGWGSLIPRQSREIGLTGGMASAKACFRAMSTAREHLGVVPYPVATDGKMQQALPEISDGFHPGQRPLPSPADRIPDSRRASWIYWRRVQCCV